MAEVERIIDGKLIVVPEKYAYLLDRAEEEAARSMAVNPMPKAEPDPLRDKISSSRPVSDAEMDRRIAALKARR